VDDLLAEGVQDVTVLDISSAALAKARKRLGAHAASVRWSDAMQWPPDDALQSRIASSGIGPPL